MGGGVDSQTLLMIHIHQNPKPQFSPHIYHITFNSEMWLVLKVCYVSLVAFMPYSNLVAGKVCTWEEVGKEEQEVTAGRSDWTAATVAAGVRIS